VLKTTGLGIDPSFGTDVSAPAGLYALSFRARQQGLHFQFYWATNVHATNESHKREFTIPASGEEWNDIEIYFRAVGDLIKLRLDPGDGADHRMEFDWIRLESATEESLRKRAAELTQRIEKNFATQIETLQLRWLLQALDGDAGLKRYDEIFIKK
jgi:hypothetical protein